jgi:hypothetical protein
LQIQHPKNFSRKFIVVGGYGNANKQRKSQREQQWYLSVKGFYVLIAVFLGILQLSNLPLYFIIIAYSDPDAVLTASGFFPCGHDIFGI